MELISLIQSSTDEYLNRSWDLVAALAAVGVFAMALIEIFRLIIQPRWILNQSIFKRWLAQANQLKAESEIVNLATGGSAYLLYSLPVSQMAGQINAAAQMALAYPARYPSIIRALGHNADNLDLDLLISGPTENNDLQEVASARNRVSNMIQRNLDALQIRIKGIWARSMQAAAVIVSITLILVFAITSDQEIESYSSLIVFAIFGGMVAPVAKDILAALKTVKNRSR